MQYDFYTDTQVEFHQVDAAGIVHFSNFYIWMELTEHAFLKKLNIPIFEKDKNTVLGWPRIQTACTYRSPLYFQDALRICLKINQIDPKFIDYTFEFYKQQLDSFVFSASGNIKVVYAKLEDESPMRQILIPSPYIAKFQAYFNNSNIRS